MASYHLGLLAVIERDRESANIHIDRVTAHNRDPESDFYMARCYALIGERDKALALLERSSRKYFPVYALEHDAWFDSLRDSERFAAVLAAARARHAEAQAAWNA
jgi:hypothetical protein